MSLMLDEIIIPTHVIVRYQAYCNEDYTAFFYHADPDPSKRNYAALIFSNMWHNWQTCSYTNAEVLEDSRFRPFPTI